MRLLGEAEETSCLKGSGVQWPTSSVPHFITFKAAQEEKTAKVTSGPAASGFITISTGDVYDATQKCPSGEIQFFVAAIGRFASTELPLQRVVLPPILQLLTDSNHGVREAAMSCIEVLLNSFKVQPSSDEEGNANNLEDEQSTEWSEVRQFAEFRRSFRIGLSCFKM
ncbi:hypothetical protein Vadar_015159 [Vaccinium darrowii]|uniref:Uncharacterized protein n=1 Tax=Vaccinium darrowii TaxID=229202 RepID=A0ACB7YN25_9ERIC|nr:hypothetical protein Vadar_015159 [Vaccinium darrowii]